MSDCIFCRIITGEIPSKPVYKDADLVAIYDINPKAPVHVLLMPVAHIKSLQEVTSGEQALLGKMMITINKIAQKLGIARDGYKVVINNGEGSGQLVLHLHLHILGGWRKNPKWEV